MKYNAWTLTLIGAGLVSLPAVIHAEESTNSVFTALTSTTISGYVDTSAHWNPGTGNVNLPVYTPNGVSGSSKADGFNLDVVALTLNKPPGEGDWGAGYNATLLFGPDAVGYNNSPRCFQERLQPQGCLRGASRPGRQWARFQAGHVH